VSSAPQIAAAGDPPRRPAGAQRLAEGLALAASPVFALMALLSALGNDPAAILCSAVPGSPLNGMATMYLLMGAVHLPPWLKLAAARPG
jgi:hypothetical protein